MSEHDGYRAAAILIERLLADAEAYRPEHWNQDMHKLAAYRQGYYDGLLLAHCQMAMGEFPERNKDVIKKALEGQT